MDVEVRKSKIHGRGVFALKDFYSSELITKTPALVVPRSEIVKGNILFPHTFGYGETHWLVPLGVAAFLNNHPKFNAAIIYDISTEEILVHAVRQILAGAEVLIQYAADHESGKMLSDKRANRATDQSE